ncbi:MAG: lasso peptide biosynthesis PqqD family chaperone [Burkholderiaceae bacterium]|nr:MAG: lasso peptide biosynthesis PqqD family chaperone [Burkholderiaceae bacterium]
MSTKATYRRNADILAASLDGELVMMSIQAGNYYSIGGVGTRVWELLEQPKSLEELVDAVVADYAVERDRCATDVAAFVDELLGLNLIEQA